MRQRGLDYAFAVDSDVTVVAPIGLAMLDGARPGSSGDSGGRGGVGGHGGLSHGGAANAGGGGGGGTGPADGSSRRRCDAILVLPNPNAVVQGKHGGRKFHTKTVDFAAAKRLMWYVWAGSGELRTNEPC